MAKIRILISLTTNDDDYQIEQAQSAEQAASKLGVSAEIIYANNDAIRCAADCLPRPFLFLLTPDKPSKCLCKRFGRKSAPGARAHRAYLDSSCYCAQTSANHIARLCKKHRIMPPGFSGANTVDGTAGESA